MTPVTTAKEAIEAAAKVADEHDYDLGPYSETTIAGVIADAIRAIPVADPVGVTVADDPRVEALVEALREIEVSTDSKEQGRIASAALAAFAPADGGK